MLLTINDKEKPEIRRIQRIVTVKHQPFTHQVTSHVPKTVNIYKPYLCQLESEFSPNRAALCFERIIPVSFTRYKPYLQHIDTRTRAFIHHRVSLLDLDTAPFDIPPVSFRIGIRPLFLGISLKFMSSMNSIEQLVEKQCW